MSIKQSSIRTQVLSNKVLFTKIREQIAEGRKVTIRAKGWSMLPLVWDDRDTLTLAAVSEDTFQKGHIVLAQLGTGRYVVHRIARVKGQRYCLRGDGNPYQEEYVHRDKIYAELVAIQRAGKQINSKHWLWKFCQHLWPSNGFLRRVLLYAYRRIVVRPASSQPRRFS